MRVLVACEFSGRVRDAFRARGHRAWSCDLLKGEGLYSAYHYQEDVRLLLNRGWDLMIAHPPCTYLAVAGVKNWSLKQREQEEALEFVRLLLAAPIPRIALENPVSHIATRIRMPDQVINPWQFGHIEVKRTCLWLKNLPLLVPTEVSQIRYNTFRNLPNTPYRWKIRSRTFRGIAEAMATQWGPLTLETFNLPTKPAREYHNIMPIRKHLYHKRYIALT